ncbi:MAG: hypothetical protein KGN01_07055 [Patescibacteria group bacterium]|nr:hypothetical protein [Patescibacteria group bacterium]
MQLSLLVAQSMKRVKKVLPSPTIFQSGEVPLRFMKADKKIPVHLRNLLVDYQRACMAGWNPPKEVEASAPPGWSEKKMKSLKKQVGTESAFKLAWWMHTHKKGPGFKKKKHHD